MSHPANLPEREITPEPTVLSRRRWLRRFAVGTLAISAAGVGGWWVKRSLEQGGITSLSPLLGGTDEQVMEAGRLLPTNAKFYPAERNPQFARVDRPITQEAEAARYCNFYEFTNFKSVWASIESFQPRPWKLEVTGLVAKPRTFDMDDILRTFALEERIYRHRCVETWAMVVPWTGFPLAALLRKVEPLPGARYVRFVTFNRPEQTPRQRDTTYPWPYTEGLTLAEASNELTFLATGMYGHELLKQHGAPIRLVVPWKYGYKSAKSLVRIELTDKKPATFWNTLAPNEYGFESNVNPAVPHPRWSQANEWMLGTKERRPTLLYNGYGEWVGKLYRS